MARRDCVAKLHHRREVLEVHLVHDARSRRDDAEVVERLLGPACRNCVALEVALELELDVELERASEPKASTCTE